MIIENDIAKSRKSFNQANHGSDNVAVWGGAKHANIIAQGRP